VVEVCSFPKVGGEGDMRRGGGVGHVPNPLWLIPTDRIYPNMHKSSKLVRFQTHEVPTPDYPRFGEGSLLLSAMRRSEVEVRGGLPSCIIRQSREGGVLFHIMTY